jgi:hypothetical protein
MAMGKSLAPVVRNIFMEHFEEVALDTADHKPAKWIRHVDDNFGVWQHGPERLLQFLNHLNSCRPTIKFTMEVDVNNTLPLLGVLIMNRGPYLATEVYRKCKRGVAQGLISRAKVICQDRKDFNKETKNIEHNLILN